jgi:hypothetical protein
MTYRKANRFLDTDHLHPTLAAVVNVIERERMRRKLGHTVLSERAGYNLRQWGDVVRNGSIRLQTLIDVAETLGMNVKIKLEKRKGEG